MPAENSDEPSQHKRPSKEELREKLEALTPGELMAFSMRLAIREHRDRIVYTILRDIVLAAVDDLSALLNSPPIEPHEWITRLLEASKKVTEMSVWLRPDIPVLSLEDAVKMAQGTKSELWRKAAISRAGKRPRAGRPSTKRRLAVRALDIKCTRPETTHREITDALCPCGKDEHTDRCREQMRQAIKLLVKFLREHGHDFRWDHIK
jgi:hypothetical protein